MIKTILGVLGLGIIFLIIFCACVVSGWSDNNERR